MMIFSIWYEEKQVGECSANDLKAELQNLHGSFDCPDSLDDFSQDVWLRIERNTDTQAPPTWEEYLEEKFPLPDDRRLTVGRICLEIPESWGYTAPEVVGIDNDGDDIYVAAPWFGLFHKGCCSFESVHNPSFWVDLAHGNESENCLEFVDNCVIEWLDPFV